MLRRLLSSRELFTDSHYFHMVPLMIQTDAVLLFLALPPYLNNDYNVYNTTIVYRPLVLIQVVFKPNNYPVRLLNAAQTHCKCNTICYWWLDLHEVWHFLTFIYPLPSCYLCTSMMTCQQAPTYASTLSCVGVLSVRRRISSYTPTHSPLSIYPFEWRVPVIQANNKVSIL